MNSSGTPLSLLNLAYMSWDQVAVCPMSLQSGVGLHTTIAPHRLINPHPASPPSILPHAHAISRTDAEMEVERVWIAEQVEQQSNEFEEMKARWAAKAAESKVGRLSIQ